jgi:hypothetical protein
VADGNLEMGLCAKCLKPEKTHKDMDSNEERGRSIRVLKCPHNTFRGGFTREQFRAGLRAGIWPLGMVVRDDAGDLRAVCGRGAAYRDPAEQLPRQWTRAI